MPHETKLTISSLFPLLLLLLLLFMPQAHSQTPTPTPLQIINNTTSGYVYIGCWNETTDLPDTNGLRALSGGINEVLPGSMTVSVCADFCAHNDTSHGPYKLAGLEYSRECWCADSLDPLSAKLNNSACDDACDGENTTACGGALRISLYNLTAGKSGDGKPGKESGAPRSWSLLFGRGVEGSAGESGGAWGIAGLVLGLGVIVGIL
ncbi:WSC domain-containing protein [Xylariaceae sp. FL0255]|nr:WSC domain-containing protein [Xylariaceae sp. FL0255]